MHIHQQNRMRRIYLNIVGKNIHQQLKFIIFLYQLVYLTLINDFGVLNLPAVAVSQRLANEVVYHSSRLHQFPQNEISFGA